MDSFLASLAPEPYVVLGVKLKRLTFGHVVLLNRFGVDPVETVVDLVLAVQICSRDFKDALSYVDSLGTLKRGILNWLFLRRVRKWDFEKAASAWREFLAANSQKPQCAQSEKGKENLCGAPMLAQIRVYLLTQCGYSPETIMDQFYGQCLWDLSAAVEQQVGEGIVGDKHREIARILNQDDV